VTTVTTATSASAATPAAAPVASPSAGRRIAGAAGILLAGFALSRVVGLLREVAVGAQFGTSVEYDLFIAAFRIPDVVFTLVAGGALGSTLVPVFSERRERGQAGAAVRLAGTVFNLIFIAAVVVAALGMVCAGWLAPLVGAGFAPDEQARLALLIRILLAQPVLLGVSEVISRYLNVTGHFLYPALAPAVYNLPIILAAIVLGPSLGAVGLALGVVAGAACYFLVQVPAGLAAGFRFAATLDLHDPGLRQIARLMVPRMVGQGAVQLSFVATTRLASFMPEGSLAALNYAWIFAMLPLGPLGMAIGNAALPAMSAQAARGEHAALGETARRTLSAILFLVVPAALLLIVAGLPIVQTLLERRAFTLESSARTAAALAFYAAGLPAHGAIEILTRSFYALQDTRTPVSVGVAGMALNVVLAYSLAGAGGPEQAYLAIAFALSTSAYVETALLWLLLRRRVPAVASPALLASLLRIALAGAGLVAATVPAIALGRALGLHPLAQVLFSGAAGGLAYLAVALSADRPSLSPSSRSFEADSGDNWSCLDQPSAHPQLLHHRPRRPRQVDPRRPTARAHRHRHWPRSPGADHGPARAGAREGHHHQGQGRAHVLRGRRRPALRAQPDRHARPRRLRLRSLPRAGLLRGRPTRRRRRPGHRGADPGQHLPGA
jgi:putative peptidoglycan lipid II flippase